jgi:hypothetical protein
MKQSMGPRRQRATTSRPDQDPVTRSGCSACKKALGESLFHLASPAREETSDGPGRGGESPALGTGRTPVREATLMVHLAVASRGGVELEIQPEPAAGADWPGRRQLDWGRQGTAGECRLERRQERTDRFACMEEQASSTIEPGAQLELGPEQRRASSRYVTNQLVKSRYRRGKGYKG